MSIDLRAKNMYCCDDSTDTVVMDSSTCLCFGIYLQLDASVVAFENVLGDVRNKEASPTFFLELGYSLMKNPAVFYQVHIRYGRIGHFCLQQHLQHNDFYHTHQLEFKNSTLWKRYSDFDKYVKLLERCYPDVPKLPSKRPLMNLSTSFLEERRTLLDSFLQRLLRRRDIMSDLLTFSFFNCKEDLKTFKKTFLKSVISAELHFLGQPLSEASVQPFQFLEVKLSANQLRYVHWDRTLELLILCVATSNFTQPLDNLLRYLQVDTSTSSNWYLGKIYFLQRRQSMLNMTGCEVPDVHSEELSPVAFDLVDDFDLSSTPETLFFSKELQCVFLGLGDGSVEQFCVCSTWFPQLRGDNSVARNLFTAEAEDDDIETMNPWAYAASGRRALSLPGAEAPPRFSFAVSSDIGGGKVSIEYNELNGSIKQKYFKNLVCSSLSSLDVKPVSPLRITRLACAFSAPSLPKHSGAVTALALDRVTQCLFSGSEDRSIQTYSIRKSQVVATVVISCQISALHVIEAESFLIVGGNCGTVAVYNFSESDCLRPIVHVLPRMRVPCTSVTYMLDPNLFYRRYMTRSRSPDADFELSHSSRISSIICQKTTKLPPVLAGDSLYRVFVTVSCDGTAITWILKSCNRGESTRLSLLKKVVVARETWKATCIAECETLKLLAIGTSTGTIHILDSVTYEMVLCIPICREPLIHLNWDNNNFTIFAAASGSSVYWWKFKEVSLGVSRSVLETHSKSDYIKMNSDTSSCITDVENREPLVEADVAEVKSVGVKTAATEAAEARSLFLESKECLSDVKIPLNVCDTDTSTSWYKKDVKTAATCCASGSSNSMVCAPSDVAVDPLLNLSVKIVTSPK